MPNDYITLKALASELNDALHSGRINKVNGTAEELQFAMRASGKNNNLVISAGATPRVFLTCAKPGNGDAKESPTTFCMLLRKHLTGGEILSVNLLGNDRVMCIKVASRNELHDEVTYNIITEIFSNGANVILTDETGKIVDAMKRIYGDGVRCLMTGFTYKLPPQNKPSIEDLQAVSVFNDLKGTELKAKLNEGFLGFSKETLQEAVAKATNMPINLVFANMLNIYGTKEYSPCVLKDESGAVKGYYAFPYTNIPAGTHYESTASLSDAIEEYFSKSAYEEKKSRDTKNYLKVVKKLRARAEKRIAECERTIASAGDGEKYLAMGEILKCNLKAIPKGENNVTLFNFYTGDNINITLNPSLSPIKNAESYFKKYNKIKGAERYAKAELETFKERVNYLDSIQAALQNCDRQNEYKEIENEINSLLGKKGTPKKGANKEKPSAPIALKIDGFDVYIGKNNKQNDEVTFKIAVGGDIWLHVKNYHGSHGVIITNGKTPDENVIKKVASYVAFYSTASAMDKVEVDYTKRKYVKKAGSLGLVHYTDYSTVLVKPCKP